MQTLIEPQTDLNCDNFSFMEQKEMKQSQLIDFSFHQNTMTKKDLKFCLESSTIF